MDDVIDGINECNITADQGVCNDASAQAVLGPRMITIQTVRGANNPDSIVELE